MAQESGQPVDLDRLRRSARASFASRAANVANEVLGGFVMPGGSVDFVIFSKAVAGHSQAIVAGAIPPNAIGGFSVGVKSGLAHWFVFRSIMNDPDIYLDADWQNAIIEALPKADDYRVYR